MKLSTRARYGTRALVELARRRDEEPISLKEIAARQSISLHYLEHLVTPLIASGIVRSVRGPRGGISLAREPRDIKLDEVVNLLEGGGALVECVETPDCCERAGFCVTRDIWGGLEKAMKGYLEGVSLQDIVEMQREREPKEQAMYYI